MTESHRIREAEDVKIIESDNNKRFSQLLKDATNDGYSIEGTPQVTSFLGLFTSWQVVMIKYKDPTKSEVLRTLQEETPVEPDPPIELDPELAPKVDWSALGEEAQRLATEKEAEEKSKND